MKENVKEIVDQLEEGVKDLFTSEAYAEHLRPTHWTNSGWAMG